MRVADVRTYSQNRLARRHFGFIDHLGRHLRDSAYGVGQKPTGALTGQFPGLKQLFDSMASASATARAVRDRVIEDWNPFSQRLLMSDARPPKMSELERSFSLIPAYVQTFVEWSHESIHILALEPFFCGRRSIDSERTFIAWNLAGEAVAHWYADMVLTPAIRAYVPDAEIAYNRRAVSNNAFHPEQAFKRIGLTDLDEILTLYVRAFLGRPNALSTSASSYPRALAHQLKEFYEGARGVQRGWYLLLRDFDFFEDYRGQFCAIEGLPSLLGTEACATASEETIEDFIHRLGTDLLPGLAKLGRQQIARVCLRRHLQTRAYYGWFLLQTIRRKWVFGLGSPLDYTALAAGLERYLARLKSALHALARGTAAGTVVEQVRTADKQYDRQVRRPLSRCQAYMKYRYRLYPFFAPTHGIVGTADEASDLSIEDMKAIAWFVMERFKWGAARSEDVAERLHHFLSVAKGRNSTKQRSAFNRLMTHPAMLASWSVRLGDIRPSENRFAEIAFEYT
jgi:hypothetical protein